MPAPFAPDLCGYRYEKGAVTTRPNTSDANDEQSVYLAAAVFDLMGVPHTRQASGDQGTAVEKAVVKHLQMLRPDLEIGNSQQARRFAQYEHLGVTKDFIKAYRASTKSRRARLEGIANLLLATVPRIREGSRVGDRPQFKTLLRHLDEEEAAFLAFSDLASEESLLKIDLTIAQRSVETLPQLRIALSSKWTLRTDRAQDCVSQGSKLAAQKRGRMPHFAVVTMEVRPAMLAIPCDGPSVDCVYHLDLTALIRAVDIIAEDKPLDWSPKRTLNRLIRQGRLRDYEDLVTEVMEIPEEPVVAA